MEGKNIGNWRRKRNVGCMEWERKHGSIYGRNAQTGKKRVDGDRDDDDRRGKGGREMVEGDRGDERRERGKGVRAGGRR